MEILQSCTKPSKGTCHPYSLAKKYLSFPPAIIMIDNLWHIGMSKQCSNNKTVTRYGPSDRPRGVSGHRADRRSTLTADSPREIWWTVSRYYTVLCLSRDAKFTKFYQYLPVDLTSPDVSNSRFRTPVMTWKWRYYDVTLWRHGRGAWHNCLLLTRSSNVNCWADVVNHVTRLWQVGITVKSLI